MVYTTLTYFNQEQTEFTKVDKSKKRFYEHFEKYDGMIARTVSLFRKTNLIQNSLSLPDIGMVNTKTYLNFLQSFFILLVNICDLIETKKSLLVDVFFKTIKNFCFTSFQL